MKEYICKEDFKAFFFSPESGTEEVISDLIIKYHLDYLHYINEENVKDFAKDLIIGILNVLDTEETVTKADMYLEFAEKVKGRLYYCDDLSKEYGITAESGFKILDLIDNVLAEMEEEK